MITLILRLVRYKKLVVLFAAASYVLGMALNARAQQQDLLTANGTGTVEVLAFGDSITYGVGDGEEPGAFVEESPLTDGTGGYPARLQTLGGFPVINDGVPGEQLVFQGVDRVPSAVQSSTANIVILYEGNNDAFNNVSDSVYGVELQRAINVVKALGKTPVLVTLYPTCCNHAPEGQNIPGLDQQILDLSSVNSLSLVDLYHAWQTTCDTIPDCYLINMPEGLHPNSVGYDVIAQMMLATLSGIDLFASDGAANLEAAFNLPTGTVIVKPDATPTPSSGD